MKSQLVVEPSELPAIDSIHHQHTPLKQFSYNDSDNFRESAERQWEQIYRMPTQSSFFKRAEKVQNKTEEKSTQQKSIPSAREAWSIYDPENEQRDLFDIFRAGKPKMTAEKIIEEGEPQKPVKRGWGNLFEKPFWGSYCQQPPPFMGAFDHVQPDFATSLNITVPSFSDYRPFSIYLQPSKDDIPNPYKLAQTSKILDNLNDSKQNKGKYYFEIESVQSKEDELDNLKESKIEHKQEPMDRSLAWSYDVLFGERSDFKYTCPAWQTTQNMPAESNVNSKVFEVYKEHNQQLLSVMESQVNLQSDIAVVLPDEFILKELSKVMQNVECELFTLEYDSMTWRLDLLSFRPQYFLKNSLAQVLREALTVASYRSRLTAALNFLRVNKYRKVYSELASQIAQFLVLFEQIVLDMSNDSTLVEFLDQISKLSPQITLLYNLMINEDYIREEGKIYDNFDFRFLHSQALIFKRITKLARNADSIELQNNSLVIKLLQTAFKPLMVLLQKIIFQENQYLELNTDLYLRYYFPNPKELLQSTSKRLLMIKEESNELYLICKIKQKLELKHQLIELQKYQKVWEKSFRHKHKLINRIRKQHRQKIKWQRQRKREQKMKQIYELKSKIYQQEEEEQIMRQDVRRRRQKELNKLKKEISERAEKRRLMENIEKEMQKNLLLDIELTEKEKLAREKNKLIQIMKIETILPEEPQETLKQPKKVEQQPEKHEIDANEHDPSELEVQSQVRLAYNEEGPIKQPQIPIEVEQEPQNNIKSQSSLIHEPLPSEPLHLESKLVPQQQRPVSENAIFSKQSIESLQQRYTQTADAFMVRHRQKSNLRNKSSSYFRLVSKPTIKQSISSLSEDQSEKTPSQSVPSDNQMDVQMEEEARHLMHRQTDLQTCLEICIDEVVNKQTEVIQHCLQFIILDKYQILSMIEFLRLTFMSGDGQNFQQFLRLAIDQGSMISLRRFTECLLFDTPLENIQRLKPAFYHTKTNLHQNEINIFEDNIEHYIGFEFQALPSILEPFFSYIHLSKYMQIFSFVLRLRHCQNLISESWKMLNSYKKHLDKQKKQHKIVDYQVSFMGKLCIIRYKISCFLKTFQNYFFWRVIEKEYKNIRPKLKDLNQLEQNHLKMLDNIIRYGLIDNPNHNISKSFKKILHEINIFYNIVTRLTLDDIPSYAWEQTQQKVFTINKIFDKELKDIEVLLFKSG